MTTRLLRLASCLAAACAFALDGAAEAQSTSAPKTLIVTGRVADAEGWPIRGARIHIGSRSKPAAITDDNGRYTISLFVGPLSGLVQAPYAETFRAVSKGWTFATSSGGGAVALQVRLVTGSDGGARVQAHATDPTIADAAAAALAGDATAPSVWVQFVGRRGAEPKAAPLTLNATAEAPVRAGAAGEGLPPFGSVPPRPPSAGAATPPTAGRPPAGRATSASPRAAAPTRTSGRTDSFVVRPSPVATPRRGGATPPADSFVVPAPSTRGTSSRRPSSGAGAGWRLFPSVDDILAERRAAARDSEARTARTDSIAADSTARAAALPPPRVVSATSTRTPAGMRPTGPPPAPAATGPGASRAAPPSTPAATTSGAGRVATPPANVPATTVARAAVTSPSGTATPRSGAAVSALPDTVAIPGDAAPPPAVARTNARGTRPAVATKTATDPPRQDPGAGASDSGRASPIRVWGGRTVPPVPAPSGAVRRGHDCACRIRGTIEVRSSRPLTERTRVVVYVAANPALRDTVELFMGSPRSFAIEGVPCGRQRIEVEPLTRRRLLPASMVPFETFECTDDRLRQIHIVLEPR